MSPLGGSPPSGRRLAISEPRAIRVSLCRRPGSLLIEELVWPELVRPGLDHAAVLVSATRANVRASANQLHHGSRLLSLEQIGAELQNPFATTSLSHLGLDEICERIEANVLAIARARTAQIMQVMEEPADHSVEKRS